MQANNVLAVPNPGILCWWVLLLLGDGEKHRLFRGPTPAREVLVCSVAPGFQKT